MNESLVRHRTRVFATVSNHISRNKAVSCKARGFFYTVMALPEDWDFSIKGMRAILKEGRDAIYSMINELEKHGYIRKEAIRIDGKFLKHAYHFYDDAQRPLPENPEVVDSPLPEKPDTVKPDTVNPTQCKNLKNKEDILNNDDVDFVVEKNKSVLSEKKPAELVREIFDHWRERTGHDKAFLSPALSTLIRKQLDVGFTVDQLKTAIDGCVKSPHHQGKNDNGQVYDSLDLIFRNDANVWRFIGYVTQKGLGSSRNGYDPGRRTPQDNSDSDLLSESNLLAAVLICRQLELAMKYCPAVPSAYAAKWDEAVKTLRSHIAPDVFATWFEPLQFRGIVNGLQPVIKAGATTRAWIEQYYDEELREALNQAGLESDYVWEFAGQTPDEYAAGHYPPHQAEQILEAYRNGHGNGHR